MDILAVENLDLWFVSGNGAPRWSAAFHPDGRRSWSATGNPKLSYREYINRARSSVNLRPVLQARTVSIQPGEKVGIVGPSGSGKSVTFFASLGLLDPLLMPHIIKGGFIYNGQSYSSPKARALLGGEVGFVFQEAMSSFHPEFSIRRQFDLVLRRKTKQSPRERANTMGHWLDRVRIPDEKWNCLPRELSGGMLQRINLAIGLSLQPKVLIADEVTSALDVTTQAQMMELLNRLIQEQNIALFFISHDLDLVEEACHRVVRYEALSSAA